MLRYELPTPRVARVLPSIDPYRNREAYVRVLSALYHAEAAALEGFSLLTDPGFVESSELFAKAAKRLVEDETKHLGDIEQLVHLISGKGVVPPTAAMREFWTAWRSGNLFALPFKASVAALFCLFSEGLGYAFLHNLAEATSDPDIRAVLRANVVDEQMHLRLSMSVLERALARESGFFADLTVYLAGYALLAKRATREQRDLVEELGLDFDVIVGSSLAFVADLLDIVVQRTQRDSKAWRSLHRVLTGLRDQPAWLRGLYWSMYLPSPPFARKVVFWWGARRRTGSRPVSAQAAAQFQHAEAELLSPSPAGGSAAWGDVLPGEPKRAVPSTSPRGLSASTGHVGGAA